MPAADDAALLRELAALRDRCLATMEHIAEVQLRLARASADRAEVARMERAEFRSETRTSLDD